MKEEKSTGRKAGGNADMPFDTDDFIRSVAVAGSNDDTSKSLQTEMRAGTIEEMPKSIEAENLLETSGAPEPQEEKPVKRKRTQPVDYESLFLLRNELRDRQGLYISRENYEILQTLVRAIRNERLSVSGLVDNIISHHIELYGDEINRIYDENSRKPVQKKTVKYQYSNNLKLTSMMNSTDYQEKSPLYVSFCTQKGGAGKSVFTTLAASYLHYEMGFNVAVIDCDYPQWSIHKLREREKGQVIKNTFYLKKAKALFQKIRKSTYPVVSTKPETALVDAKRFLSSEFERGKQYDLVLFDLPGTVNNRDVVKIFFGMDYLFVPITTSRINMESILAFVTNINDALKTSSGSFRLKNVYTFWNRMTNRERQELYDCYEGAIAELGISIMQTRIPNSVKYDREQSIMGNEYLFLSSVFPPDKPLLKGSNWDVFMDEFLKITNLKITE